jgi:hypothetical protein
MMMVAMREPLLFYLSDFYSAKVNCSHPFPESSPCSNRCAKSAAAGGRDLFKMSPPQQAKISESKAQLIMDL